MPAKVSVSLKKTRSPDLQSHVKYVESVLLSITFETRANKCEHVET